MKWILIAIFGLAALGGCVAIAGALLPKAHTAARRATLRQPPEAVYRVITDVETYPKWRPGVKSVERTPFGWREIDSRGSAITYETVEASPPRRFVARIADSKLPFGGTWTYDIEPASNGSALTITENGEVYNPIFRFVSRFIMGHTATIDAYLKALGGKFGETSTSNILE
ncbi:MAG: SRPBCC family protein [Bryobacteraceae bacterium]